MQDYVYKTLEYKVNDKGVAVITIDVKDRPVNVLTLEMYDDLHRLVEQFSADEAAKAAVIQSGKETFFAGGDLKRLVNMYARKRSPELAYEESRLFTTALRKLELSGKPIAVAINGSAMGGGLELALACNRRVAVNEPRVFMGLPEVTLGLLPGGGGTQRLARMLGVKVATDLVLSGRTFTPEEALEMGIVDELVDREQLFAAAEKQVLEVEEATRPWDQKGFSVPGGSGLNGAKMNNLFLGLSRDISVKYRHNYPAPIAALRCLFKGSSCGSMDKGLEIESREFSKLTGLVQTRNIIRSLFLNKGSLDRLAARPDDIAKLNCETLAVIAADTLPEMTKGKLEQGLSKARFKVVEDLDAAADAALIFGEHTLDALQDFANKMPKALLCVAHEKSLISVQGNEALLARCIGLNIPVVDNWQCIELGTLGGENDDTNLAGAMDLAKALRKTPTVQKFSGTWFSQACLEAYNQEAEQLSKDGIGTALIQNSARFAGFAQNPLQNESEQASTKDGIDTEIVKQCLFTRQALLAARYLEEGNISSIDADIISLLGNGFPSWTGGVLSYIDMLGVKSFVEQCGNLQQQFGERFTPSEWLKNCDEESIYPELVE